MEIDQLLELVYSYWLVKNLRDARIEAFLHNFVINERGHSDYHCLIIVRVHQFVHLSLLWCEHHEVTLPALQLWVYLRDRRY